MFATKETSGTNGFSGECDLPFKENIILILSLNYPEKRI